MPITPREQWQKFLLNLNLPDLSDPPYLQEFFVSNIVQRTLAILYGFDAYSQEMKTVRVTPDGSLIVSPRGTPNLINQTFRDIFAGGEERIYTFDDNVNVIDVFTGATEVQISRSVDGRTYQDMITLPPHFFYSFQASTKSIYVRNNDPDNECVIQIVGWR